MIIGRTHISKSSVQGYLNVTTRATIGSLGRKFAPQWAWVAGLKGMAGFPKLTWEEYTTKYNSLLESLPVETWRELALLGKQNGGVIRFACFCSPSSVECHTELLVRYMEATFPSCKREQPELPEKDERPEFRVIVCGGRDFEDYEHLKVQLDRILKVKLKSSRVIIISGCARGADILAIRYAEESNLSVEKYPADWKAHGKAAGFRRNEQMLKVANGVIAFPGGVGTSHMIAIAEKAGVKVVRA